MNEYNFLLNIGNLLLSRKEWENSILVFTKLLSLSNISNKEKAIVYFDRSTALFNLKEYELSRNDAVLSMKCDLDCTKSFCLASEASLCLNDHYEALRVLRIGRMMDKEVHRKYYEVYFKYHYKSKILPNYKYLAQFEKFKKILHEDSIKAMEFHMEIEKIRENPLLNSSDLEDLLLDMREILFENCDFQQIINSFEAEKSFFNANLCLKALKDLIFMDKSMKIGIYERMINNIKDEEINYPKQVIENIGKNMINSNFKERCNLTEIISIFYENLHLKIDDHSLIDFYLEDITENEAQWVIRKSLSERITPENFYQKNKELSRNYYWKYYTKKLCSFINGCFSKLIITLIKEDMISPYIINKDPKTGNEEYVKIEVSAIIYSLLMKDIKNPIIFYKDLGVHVRMLRGTIIMYPFLVFPYSHSMSALITNKIDNGKRLFYLVDLTGPQFDIFSMDKKGYPVYIRKMGTSQYKVDEDYLIGNVVQDIDAFLQKNYKGGIKNRYFPKDILEDIVVCSRKAIKENIKH